MEWEIQKGQFCSFAEKGGDLNLYDPLVAYLHLHNIDDTVDFISYILMGGGGVQIQSGK